jgi:DNA-binding response OmpR family regulator
MTTDNIGVLIVEDDADIRELLKVFLEADGYQVRVAADGIDALAQLQNGFKPRMILLDLMMPRMDGEQFLKQMRAAGKFAKIPVVIMSGHCAGRITASQIGAACCLMKPVELEELLGTVRRLVSIRSKDRKKKTETKSTAPSHRL